MSELDKAIVSMFQEMDTIDNIVSSILDEEALESLTALGLGIGKSLQLWNSAKGNEHAAGWLSKKAYDSINHRIFSSIVDGMNRSLGLPEDYRG